MRSREIPSDFGSDFKFPDESKKSEERKVQKPPQDISRRKFLHVMGRVAAGLAAGAVLESSPLIAKTMEQKKETEPVDVEKILKEDWEKYKKVIEGENVKENIEYIQNKFGETGDRLTYKARFDLLTYSTIRTKEREGVDIYKDPSTRQLLATADNEFIAFWDKDTLRRRGERNQGNIQFEGFESLPGAEPDKIKHSLDATYGKAWLYGTVDKIRYVPEDRSASTFQVAGVATGRDLTSALMKNKDQEITIYKQNDYSEWGLNKLLAHELAHHNDWEASHNLTLAERLQFIRDVSERYDEEDKFDSEYVDKNIVEDSQAHGLSEGATKHRQLLEYWATIVEERFANPRAFPKTDPKDNELVQKWYNKINEK